MMAGMNTETCDAVELAALREIVASRPEAAPPAGWEAVRSFEAEHGVVLPEPYRTFVAEVCDGLPVGPPYYGLLPLADIPDDWDTDGSERRLAEPFPLTTAWDAEGDGEALSEEETEALWEALHGHGSVLLGTDGCAMNWHLIVTGPQRGHIWLTDENGAVPFGTPPGSLMPGTPGFTRWVTHWAQGRPWFADTPGIDPEEAAELH
ncbi:SMI1/KNR4 family protein [Streptomyces sp. NPDC012421]|uniref:SMI1/KNR4 family protein n=1 Tax=Streptomyces sp. NPDC012421 TaxID=3364832 RepID=UPI0036E95917